MKRQPTREEYLDAVDALNRMAPPERNTWLKAFGEMSTFAAASLKVRDKDGVLRPMKMRKSQHRLNALINRQLREQGFVRIVAAKARQVMVSTQTAAEYWKHCVFQPGRKAMVFAHKEDAAKNLFDYYATFHKHYRQFGPFALPPLVSDTDRRLLYSNDSLIQCFTGGNPDALNSYRATCIHFSEAALIPNFAALLNNANGTLPLRPGTMMIIESSARGRNTFHELVQRARAGKSHWGLYFFGWQDHDEYVMPLQRSVESFQKTLDKEETRLWTELRLTFEQILWRRMKIDEFNGNVDMFKQEFPSNVDEAFIGSGRSYFQAPIITKSYAPLEGETGRLEQDMSTGRPLVRFIPDKFGEVRVFRRPERGELYAAGADPTKGSDPSMKTRRVSDPDYLGAHILNIRTGEQCARLRVRATPIEGARRVADLCRWYGYAVLTPEANDPGFIEGLVEDNYPEELITRRDPTADIRNGAEVRSIHQLGWLTTERSRRQLISKLEAALFDGSIVIRDDLTYGELCSFVVKDDGRAEHDDGCHDDLVFGLALAVDAMLRADAIFTGLRRMREKNESHSRAIPVKLFGRKSGPDYREIDNLSYRKVSRL